jgi:hypothetical protein
MKQWLCPEALKVFAEWEIEMEKKSVIESLEPIFY